MPCFLQPAQHHDLNQAANMQGFCRGIKANISGNDTLAQRLVEALIVRAIGQKATLHHDGHEF